MLTQEQLDLRTHGIGSSDMPAICGVAPYRTPLDVWVMKATPSRGPLVPPFENAATEAGQFLEDAVARLYAHRTGFRLRRAGTLRHKTDPWALATPDRLVVGARRGLEVKLVGSRVAHHWDGGPPDYVRVQVDWQMHVLGFDEWDIAAMLGTDLRVYRIARDPDLEADLVEVAREFWHEYVLADVPPPPVDEEDRRRYLALRYPRSQDGLAEATPEIEAAAMRLRDARAARDAADLVVKAAENDVLELLGDQRGARGDWGSVMAPSISGRVDWQAVAREMAPEVSDEVVERHRGAGHRQVRIYLKKESKR